MERLEEECRRRHSGAPMTYEKYSSRLKQLRKQAARAGVASSHTPGTTPLHFWDIPWPPAGNCLFLSPGDSPGLKKRKMKEALLFWHMDKFLVCCGRRLLAGHREAVLTKVAGLSREVVEAVQRSRLYAGAAVVGWCGRRGGLRLAAEHREAVLKVAGMSESRCGGGKEAGEGRWLKSFGWMCIEMTIESTLEWLAGLSQEVAAQCRLRSCSGERVAATVSPLPVDGRTGV
ncbi:unnamed protein product [Closterium sp. Yama58-4]|nr:unnamed protein product [Closterium sp. Yama58-4]